VLVACWIASRIWVSSVIGSSRGAVLIDRGVDRAGDLVLEDAVHHTVLLEPAEAVERVRHDGRAEVVAAAGEILDLGPRAGSRPRSAA
jgi:hypothetical protein